MSVSAAAAALASSDATICGVCLGPSLSLKNLHIPNLQSEFRTSEVRTKTCGRKTDRGRREVSEDDERDFLSKRGRVKEEKRKGEIERKADREREREREEAASARAHKESERFVIDLVLLAADVFSDGDSEAAAAKGGVVCCLSFSWNLAAVEDEARRALVVPGETPHHSPVTTGGYAREDRRPSAERHR